ncbi:sugar transferase [Jannaschia sp. LMIT008]|uniref:sugar transferase n=1 Tax=Jannaschia maritima TaxID=3032585 RepID=UPI002811EA87|nr:sugar transferase [Jannaschia sp. LMIT008]
MMTVRTDDAQTTVFRDVSARGGIAADGIHPTGPVLVAAGDSPADRPSPTAPSPVGGLPAPVRRPAIRGAAGAALDRMLQDESADAARPVRSSLYRSPVKRALDLILVFAFAPIVAPIIGLLALLVMRDGGQPFYGQDRIGRGGRVYRIWKLRTMVCDADALLEAHLRTDPAARAEWNSKQKLLAAPRITRIGRLLRKTSLDELPQLWNVVTGDMSLVGPRPMMVSQRRLYRGRDYFQLRPGITGLWQISDRNASTFADRAKFDTVYNRILSLPTDLGILLATIRVVLRGTGH